MRRKKRLLLVICGTAVVLAACVGYWFFLGGGSTRGVVASYDSKFEIHQSRLLVIADRVPKESPTRNGIDRDLSPEPIVAREDSKRTNVIVMLERKLWPPAARTKTDPSDPDALLVGLIPGHYQVAMDIVTGPRDDLPVSVASSMLKTRLELGLKEAERCHYILVVRTRDYVRPKWNKDSLDFEVPTIRVDSFLFRYEDATLVGMVSVVGVPDKKKFCHPDAERPESPRAEPSSLEPPDFPTSLSDADSVIGKTVDTARVALADAWNWISTGKIKLLKEKKRDPIKPQSKSDTGDDRPMNIRQSDLVDLWKLNEYHVGETGRAAGSVEDMEKYFGLLHPTASGIAAIKGGKIIWVWDDAFFSELKLEERGKYAVAWDKSPDENGNIAILFGNGIRKMVSKTEFDELNKYRPKKK